MNKEISARTKSAFRQILTDSTNGAIEEAFRDEGFLPAKHVDLQDSSSRRITAETYLANIDWSDPSVPKRLARAMNTLLEPLSPEHNFRYHDPRFWDRFVRLMKEDGWMVTNSGEVFPPSVDKISTLIDTSRLTDPSGVQEQLDRLRNVQGDAPAVIGASKELVESTAKAILNELGDVPGSGVNFQSLVGQVNEALGLTPKSGGKGIDSEQSTKRILGGATNIVLGLNELRNAYGTGHGPKSARVGLYKRHADLSVNAAALWCQLAVDTFNDPHAPWRNG